MLVGAGQRPAAVDRCGQVERRSRRLAAPVAVGHAIEAQAGDTAVRVDVQAQVGPGTFVVYRVVVMAIALQPHRRQHFAPGRAVVRVAFGAEAAIQGSRRRMVAGEEAGVDVDALQHARHTQADHRLVMALEALAAGFPAVHPLAAVVEHAFLPHRFAGLQHAAGGGEPFVADGDHLAAQVRVGEVEVVAEGRVFGVHARLRRPQSCCRRNRAILLISASAVANSSSAECWMRSSKAARI